MLYQLYENVITAYKNNNDHDFVVAACNWMEAAKNNPFEDTVVHELFFNAQKYYRNWRRQGIDMRSARRNMIALVKEIASHDLENPYPEQDEPTKEEEVEDIRFVMMAMVKAYNLKNDVSFKQFVIHLMDISKENPFQEGSEEYKCFDEMMQMYNRVPPNMRRVFVVAENLCDIINYTEIDPHEIKKVINETPQKVLGVIPEEEKEKKSWFKFLHPWKKEGE